MFWTVTVVAVREEQRQTSLAQPLRFARGDELIDNNLRRVGKIAKLRFPNDQRVRIVQRISELKTEDAEFRQG